MLSLSRKTRMDSQQSFEYYERHVVDSRRVLYENKVPGEAPLRPRPLLPRVLHRARCSPLPLCPPFWSLHLGTSCQHSLSEGSDLLNLHYGSRRRRRRFWFTCLEFHDLGDIFVTRSKIHVNGVRQGPPEILTTSLSHAMKYLWTAFAKGRQWSWRHLCHTL